MLVLDDLMNFARKNEASDIHLSTKHPPILRVLGEMVPMRVPPLTAQDVETILYSVMNETQKTQYKENHDIDFSINLEDNHRFRVNAYCTLNGPAVVMRSIPTHIRSLVELDSPPILENLCSLNKGLVLVTGPTGSGKSTTIAAMINHINQNDHKHIITLEDPIEFVYQSKNSLIDQREIGLHTHSFEQALRSALREDPDVIVVGEMRDLKTIHAALTAAETGHLVLGTLHTNSAAQTIDRIIDVFPPDDKDMARTMLASTIEAVIAQTLVKTKDGMRRVAAYEIMVATSAVRNLIREAKIAQLNSLIQTGSKFGMIEMKESISALFKKGIVGVEAVQSLLIQADTAVTSEKQKIEGTRGVF